MEFDADELALRERGEFRAGGGDKGLLSWLGGARERTVAFGTRAGQRSADARDATAGFIRRYPLGAVAIGFGVGIGFGLVAGALLARR